MKHLPSELKNLITDVEGILVGTSENPKLSTGVTVLSGQKPFLAAVDVRGGGPGTRETDLLSLENSVGRVDAIVLSGGSAFGLDASSEIQKLLRQDQKGYKVGNNIIPLVPSAVIFDLKPQNNYWTKEKSEWEILGNNAYKNLKNSCSLGSVGAGYGATTGTIMGGQGSSSWKQKYSDGNDYTVGAIIINNAVGNPLHNKGPHFLSGHLEIGKEFGGLGSCNETFDGIIRAKRVHNSLGNSLTFNQQKKLTDYLSNTVIGVVATDAPLGRNDLKRLAIMSHDGIARSISPSHTPMDGDTIFAITTNEISLKNHNLQFSKDDLFIIGSRASDCVSRACNRAVFESQNFNSGKPTWKKLFEN